MVAIKNREMPKGCLDCDFYEGENTYCDGDVLIPYGFFDDGRENKRHPDCPLVEIEERKGKWEYKQLGFRKYGLVCTSCGYAIQLGYDFTSMEEFKDMVKRKLQDPHITMDKYCCKCGSRNDR